jgi:glyoxylase-like metal-dependent hydrolase (beta-lactamase superfamily II)
MLVETFPVGTLYTNCYVACCPKTKEALIIDPGLEYAQESTPINNYIDKEELKVKFIINTHGHDDHIKGDSVFQEKYKVPLCIHRLDEHYLGEVGFKPSVPVVLLDDGSQIVCGEETLKVLHTPGHTQGSICLIGEKLVFTGDTLFAGSIGRTDFKGGSIPDMQASLQKIKQLPDYLLVYAGHGETTIMAQEKRANPFLTNQDMFF